MTQCSEFRREMSTHGRRGLLYIYMYAYTIIMANPAPQPAPYWRICSVRFSGKGRGNIYDFILFIKCSSFLLPLLLAVSLSLPLSLALSLFWPARWWYLQFFAYICRIVRAPVSRPQEPVGHSRHSSPALSISGVMTNAVCNYCIYSVSAHWSRRRTRTSSRLSTLPASCRLPPATCLMSLRNGKKISEMSHINNAPDGAHFVCYVLCLN